MNKTLATVHWRIGSGLFLIKESCRLDWHKPQIFSD